MAFHLTPASELNFGTVDEGTYTATFAGFTGPEQGKFGPIIRMQFRITDDDDFEGNVIDQMFGVDTKKFYNAVAAVAGGAYPDTGGDLGDFIGAQVTIEVTNVIKNGDEYSNVTKVVASRRKRRKAAPAPPPEDDDDPYES